MGLIPVESHTDADIEHWNRLRMADMAHAQSDELSRKVNQSMEEIQSFAESKKSVYVSVSWGKDSVVTAHLACRALECPTLVHVKVWPIYNPYCDAVAQNFVARHDVQYQQIVVHMGSHEKGWRFEGTMMDGFDHAHDSFGDHISGMRREESGVRKIRFNRWGLSSPNTCAPIGWWSTQDVFSYLKAHDLPIHPAYAMTRGGQMDRSEIRVDVLGDTRGQQYGRLDWEKQYYSNRMQWLRRTWEKQTGIQSNANMPFFYDK